MNLSEKLAAIRASRPSREPAAAAAAQLNAKSDTIQKNFQKFISWQFPAALIHLI